MGQSQLTTKTIYNAKDCKTEERCISYRIRYRTTVNGVNYSDQ